MWDVSCMFKCWVDASNPVECVSLSCTICITDPWHSKVQRMKSQLKKKNHKREEAIQPIGASLVLRSWLISTSSSLVLKDPGESTSTTWVGNPFHPLTTGKVSPSLSRVHFHTVCLPVLVTGLKWLAMGLGCFTIRGSHPTHRNNVM